MKTYDPVKDWQYDPRSYSVPFMGLKCGQAWDDLLLWERFFNLYQARAVFELGTGGGGLALFLALQCYQRGLGFATLDSQDWFDKKGLPALLKMNCYSIDLWHGGVEIVKGFIAAHYPVCLFCDDGDKPREWATLGPELKPGDFIAVHDWEVEFKPENIGILPVKMIMREECEAQGSITRWFIREQK